MCALHVKERINGEQNVLQKSIETQIASHIVHVYSVQRGLTRYNSERGRIGGNPGRKFEVQSVWQHEDTRRTGQTMLHSFE